MDPNVGTVVPSKLISVRPVHPANVLAPILVIVEGIIVYSRPVQPWNAFAPILVTPDDTIREVIPV